MCRYFPSTISFYIPMWLHLISVTDTNKQRMSSVNTTRANCSMYHELIASNIWLTLLVDYIQTLDTSSKYFSCTLKIYYYRKICNRSFGIFQIEAAYLYSKFLKDIIFRLFNILINTTLLLKTLKITSLACISDFMKKYNFLQ